MNLVTRRKRLIAVSAFISTVIVLSVFKAGYISEANTSLLLPPVTATKAVVDIAGTVDGNADPGDTLEYTPGSRTRTVAGFSGQRLC